MILLDTNVLSSLILDPPDPAAVRWLDEQVPDQVWTTVISVSEARFGIARLPAGRRRRRLEAAFAALLNEDLAGRVAMVDHAAADAAGTLAARRQSRGRPVDVRDTLIAGIALARGATIATRNARHFADLDLPIVNPWTDTHREPRGSRRD